ncbi:hypothetical protein WG915_09530 [Corynebacterium sp. H128]|uniref:hypothetical protein n=1 Tax=Corynebacterium sp. H128 TaxID=3133427 RepID=UPI0030B174AF
MSLEAKVYAPLARVEIKAYTALAVSGVEVERDGLRVRVAEAEVYWRYIGSDWCIDFIQLSGPYIKKDGSDSKQTASFATKLSSSRPSNPALPAEIEAAALEWKPDWVPEMSEIPYERDPERESSL